MCQRPDRKGGHNCINSALPYGRASDTSSLLSNSQYFESHELVGYVRPDEALSRLLLNLNLLDDALSGSRKECYVTIYCNQPGTGKRGVAAFSWSGGESWRN